MDVQHLGRYLWVYRHLPGRLHDAYVFAYNGYIADFRRYGGYHDVFFQFMGRFLAAPGGRGANRGAYNQKCGGCNYYTAFFIFLFRHFKYLPTFNVY